jgi:hypothetical protein
MCQKVRKYFSAQTRQRAKMTPAGCHLGATYEGKFEMQKPDIFVFFAATCVSNLHL